MKNNISSLCHQLLWSKLPRSRVLIGLLLSLCGNTRWRSVTQLSLSSSFQHQYASITDLLSCLSKDGESLAKVRAFFVSLSVEVMLAERPDTEAVDRILLAVDTTPCPHPFSETLADRTAIVCPNPMFQAYRLSKGYLLSSLNVAGFDGSWNLPLSIQRVGPEQTASQCAHQQMEAFLQVNKPGIRSTALVVQAADSSYGNIPFLLPLRKHPNLVNICRLRSGLKVYVDHRRETGQTASSTNKIYGQELFLTMASDTKMYQTRWHETPQPKVRTSISERPADERHESYELLGNRHPRAIKVIIEVWRNLLLRGNLDQESMSDHPVDIVRIQQLDALTGKPVFKKEMYLVISGQRRAEITGIQARKDYSYRKDIETYFRSAKQRMLLQEFQTSRVDHLDAYLNVVQLAGWFTYTLADQTEIAQRSWERYAEPPSELPPTRLTFAQAIRAANDYLLTLDLKPFAPQKQKGGTGRAKGQKQVPRRRHKVVKKRQKKAG